ncbi:helix-turn-helix transcriptional regulator [Streptomyces sp. NPDC054887]
MSPRDGKPGRSVSGLLPLVGRSWELETILATVRERPAVVTIEGEAGAGKSRLAEEAAAILGASGDEVVTGLCYPLREPAPAGPIIDALRRMTPEAEDAPLAEARALLFPQVAQMRDLTRDWSDARSQRFQFVQAVRTLLESLSSAVLIVEDVHWADDLTREVLLVLARDLPQSVALLLTYRRDDLPTGKPLLGAPYRHPPGTSGVDIVLAPLSAQDVRKAASMVIGAQAAPELAHLLYERSKGLPLVLEEDLLTLGPHAQVGRLGQTQHLPLAAVLESAPVPRALREAVLGRLAGLPRDAVAVVHAAAVLNVAASQELLVQVARLDSSAAEEGLIDALNASALIEGGDGTYGFRHGLAQQVVYEDIAGPFRNQMHRRAIEALRAQSTPPLVQIAHHLKALGDTHAWLGQARATAEQAIAVGDEGTATAILKEMLQEPDLGPEERAWTALVLSLITLHSVDLTSARATLRRIIADPNLPVPVRGQVRTTLATFITSQDGDHTTADNEFKQAIAELREEPPGALFAMAMLSLPDNPHSLTENKAWAARAEELSAGHSPSEASVYAESMRLVLDAASGEDMDVWQRVDRLPRCDPDPGIRRSAALGLVFAGSAAMFLGLDSRATPLLEEGGDLARRSGSPVIDAFSRHYLAWMALLGGRWDSLEDRFTEVCDEFPDMRRLHIERALATGLLAAARGGTEHAVEQFDHALTHAEKTAYWLWLVQAAAGIARIRLNQGDAEEAWRATLTAQSALRRKDLWTTGLGFSPVLVEAALSRGAPQAAKEWTSTLENGLRGRNAPAAQAELLLCQALLLQGSEPGRARGLYEEASVTYRTIGRPYDAAQTMERAADLRTADDRETAVQQLRGAADVYKALGATFDMARSGHKLRTLGYGSVTAVGRRGYGDQLSPREQEVADLLAQGCDNKTIAATLFLSVRTVEHHVANVLKKLKVTHRSQLH